LEQAMSTKGTELKTLIRQALDQSFLECERKGIRPPRWEGMVTCNHALVMGDGEEMRQMLHLLFAHAMESVGSDGLLRICTQAVTKEVVRLCVHVDSCLSSRRRLLLLMELPVASL